LFAGLAVVLVLVLVRLGLGGFRGDVAVNFHVYQVTVSP
jgi:hypothetical protein